jgi:hypothetical protein
MWWRSLRPPTHSCSPSRDGRSSSCGGVFHLRGAEASAGRAVLRLRAEVSDLDASGAKVQGGTIDLAFSYEHGKGKAAFTREGGRHVEIFVTSLRNEPSQARSL